MKSNTLYASVIAMLFISTIAFGTVLSDSDGCGNSAEKSASASCSNPYDEKSESGWYWEYTTRGGSCDWSFSNHADSDAWVILMLGEGASATGIGKAEVTGPVSNTAYVNASVSGTGSYDYQLVSDDPDPDSDSGSGTDCFEAYTGICIDVVALAVASIEEGSGCYANAHAKANGSVSLSEN